MGRAVNLAVASAAGVLLAAGLAGAMHIVNPEMDPVTRALSDYVYGRHGWMLAAACIVLGLGVLLLAAAFHQVDLSISQQVGVRFLIGAGLCLIIAGIFPIDNTTDGSFNSVPGAVHAAAGNFMSPLVVMAMLLLSEEFSLPGDNLIMTGAARGLALLGGLILVALLSINLIARIPVGGLGQRLFMSVVGAWLVLAALRLVLVARTAASA